MNIEPTKTFNKTLSELGENYSSAIIDNELCAYRKINDAYDIEISGLNNNRIKNPNFTVYVWKLLPGKHIVEQYNNIHDISELKTTLQSIVQKYQNLD